MLENGSVEFIPFFGTDENMLGPGYWYNSRGSSALTIFRFFRRDPELTNKIEAKVAHPLDIDDFGRCVDLLDSVPEWRERIQELAVLSPAGVSFPKIGRPWRMPTKPGIKPRQLC